MTLIKHGQLLLLAAALAIAGCAKDEYGNTRPMTDTQKGALIGAAAGAVIGLTTKDKKKGVLIGAVGGGLAGAAVGHYMDRQKQDLEKVLRPEIDSGLVTVTALPNDQLQITMTSSTAFAVDSATIEPGFHSTLDKIAQVLVRYGKTHLAVIGHTDSTGSDAYNQTLSERRAGSVKDYLIGQSVIAQRVDAFGQGESQPRATNATAEGRQLNRRVEIVVTPIVAE